MKTIDQSTTLRISRTAGNFIEPGEASRWLAERWIHPDAKVSLVFDEGDYRCTRIVGHPQGWNLRWRTPGSSVSLKPDHLSLSGNAPDALVRDRLANEAAVRDHYPVTLEHEAGIAAMAAGGQSLGIWDAFLSLNTGDVSFGVTTGIGLAIDGDTNDLTDRRYDDPDDERFVLRLASGAGGGGFFRGACFYGYENSCGVADHGGVINDHDCAYLFGGKTCRRSDFKGGFVGHDVLLVGGRDYCHRANHAGYCYSDRLTALNAGGTILEATNSASVIWAHGCRVSGGETGVAASWGASVKLCSGSIHDNARVQVRAGLECAIDARGVSVASAGKPIGVWADGGSIDLRSLGGRTSSVSGHRHDYRVEGPGAIRRTPAPGLPEWLRAA